MLVALSTKVDKGRRQSEKATGQVERITIDLAQFKQIRFNPMQGFE
jgi:hypothetical protein